MNPLGKAQEKELWTKWLRTFWIKQWIKRTYSRSFVVWNHSPQIYTELTVLDNQTYLFPMLSGNSIGTILENSLTFSFLYLNKMSFIFCTFVCAKKVNNFPNLYLDYNCISTHRSTPSKNLLPISLKKSQRNLKVNQVNEARESYN